MIPDHAPQIGVGDEGLIYVDDFEGTKASIDLRFPLISWTLASTPYGAKDRNGNILFPEAGLFDNLDYGKNRAKLAWYNIEPILQERNNPNNPIRNNLTELSDPRVRSVAQQEIFPQRTPDFGQNRLVTFDLSFYPRDKGPYNYDAAGIDGNGSLVIQKAGGEGSCGALIKLILKQPILNSLNSGYSILLSSIPILQEVPFILTWVIFLRMY